jgi:hypothetical protein
VSTPPDSLLALGNRLIGGIIHEMPADCIPALFIHATRGHTVLSTPANRPALYTLLSDFIRQNTPSVYPAGVNTDSQGFVRIIHPNGYQVGSLDTNAISLGELALVQDMMKRMGRGRK